jgi:hypothetical protein
MDVISSSVAVLSLRAPARAGDETKASKATQAQIAMPVFAISHSPSGQPNRQARRAILSDPFPACFRHVIDENRTEAET